MDIKNTVGIRINSVLAMRKMKQKELAQILGVKDNIISYYCNGSRVPSLQQIATIAEKLDVTTDYLLGLTNDPDPKRSAVDELSLSPNVIKRFLMVKEQSTQDSNNIDKINRVLEYDDVWKILYEIHDYITALKVDAIYDSLRKEHSDEDLLAQKLLSIAEEYKDSDIDMYDFLMAKAQSCSHRPLIRLGLEDREVAELIYMKLQRDLTELLLDIEKESDN